MDVALAAAGHKAAEEEPAPAAEVAAAQPAAFDEDAKDLYEVAGVEVALAAAGHKAAESDVPVEFDLQLAAAVCSAGGLTEHLRSLVKAYALAPPEESDAAMKAAFDALRVHNASMA